MARKKEPKTRARSSVTGKFVSKSYAKKHPRTTVVERFGTTGTGPGKSARKKR